MNKNTRGLQRQKRIRKKIRAVGERIRLTVHRSNKYMYAQLIDDKSGKTLAGVSEKQLDKGTGTRVERAKQLGTMIAQLALEKKVAEVVFDKGRYTYHGRVRALAEVAREGGLQF